MNNVLTRRKCLLAAASLAASLPFITGRVLARPTDQAARHNHHHESLASAHASLAELERASNGRLGVFALATAGPTLLSYRADERFPLCSTFKVMLIGAVLARSRQTEGLLTQHILYGAGDLVAYSPITQPHAGNGMNVAALCAAALQYSDNTAANLLLNIVGGPAAVTAFARAIGDDTFRLDRIEPELNTAVPGDPRDTSSPAAMARSLQRLVLGDVLGAPQRQQLNDWMRGNTTGHARIRAGVPAAWPVADKTGTGDYGTTNDIAVLWPTGLPPVVLAIYFTQHKQDAKMRDDMLAAVAQVLAATFG
ncbi:class A beta-lactamase [Paraburkholderia hayleyella]|uniref:class A beta-lactamase n=1 Tax=Paraburkholderia hayleyella TaxID=2152889 RepID=UPI0012912B05|nr:class A beta-lactamase [Paraburkholderia hayleyella]